MKKEVIAIYVDNFPENLIKRKMSVAGKNLTGGNSMVFLLA